MTGRALACALVVVCALVANAAATDAQPGLATCVAKWNDAPLGNGRRYVNAEGALDRRALMVRFSDGTCGVVFSRGHGKDGGGFGVYVQVMRGDWIWVFNPVDPMAVTDANIQALFALADRQTNVRVLAPSGRVAAVAGQSIATATFPAAVPPGPPCRTIVTAPPFGSSDYRAYRHGPSCATTRELLYAYEDGEGRASRHDPGTRVIVGWRCTGRLL